MNCSTSTDVAALQAVCEALHRQGLASRLVVLSVCGETDLRLQVGGPRPGLELEILGPYDGTPTGDSWCGVRMEAGDRVDWAGPPRPCTSDELLRFALDMLLAPVTELQTRYRRLG